MTVKAPGIGSDFFTRTVSGGEIGGTVIYIGSSEVSSGNPFPVSIIGALGTVTLGAGAAAIGTVGVTGSVAVTGTFFQATQPVSATALPLPTGASTSANQSTGNTSLASIDGKTPALVSGAVPVVDASLATLITSSNTKLDTLNTSINTSGPLPAGTNVIGKVSLQANGADVTTATPLPITTIAPTVLYAPISAATAGASNTLVAANATKAIRVVGFALVSTAGNTVTFFSNTTALTGAMAFAANGGISAPQSTAGLFQTATNEALKLTLASAAQVSGWLVYQLV